MKLVVLVLGLVLAGTVAHAQQKKPDAAALKKANNHFKLGQEFFKSGQWDRAIAEYEAALELTGEPLMIFNLALAHDRAGRPEKALELYRKYLEQGPDGAIADEARGYVAKLTPVVDKIKADRDNAAKRKAADDAAKQADAAKLADAAKQADAAKLAELERERKASSLEVSGKIQRILGLSFAGVGVALVAYGAKRGLDAGSIADELSNHVGAWTDNDIRRDEEGRSANTQMIAFTIAGGVAVIGGTVLYFVGRGAGARAERLRVGAAPTRGGATASLTLRF